MGVFWRNNDWWIDYYVSGKRYREKVGPSKVLAENAFRKRKIEAAENKFLDVRRENKIKFEDFANEYIELHSKVNNRSWSTDYRNLELLKRFFKGKCLDEITPRHIEQFKSEYMARGVAPATVNRKMACLKSMFNKAIAWKRFSGENPVKGIKFFKLNNARKRFLEKEEIARLLTNCRGYLKPIVIIALNTGMRRGEILALRWKDVDLRRGVILLTNTKNGESREVPINEQVKTALLRLPKYSKSEYVFIRKGGEPIADIKKTFSTALKKSGIKDCTFHTLRHTFASHLVMASVDLNTVRELLGHKSLQMTMRYSHLSPNHKQRAVDVLGRRMDTIWTLKPNHDLDSKTADSVTYSKVIS